MKGRLTKVTWIRKNQEKIKMRIAGSNGKCNAGTERFSNKINGFTR